MAEIEVIHIPFGAQLDESPAFRARAPSESVVSFSNGQLAPVSPRMKAQRILFLSRRLEGTADETGTFSANR